MRFDFGDREFIQISDPDEVFDASGTPIWEFQVVNNESIEIIQLKQPVSRELPEIVVNTLYNRIGRELVEPKLKELKTAFWLMWMEIYRTRK